MIRCFFFSNAVYALYEIVNYVKLLDIGMKGTKGLLIDEDQYCTFEILQPIVIDIGRGDKS